MNKINEAKKKKHATKVTYTTGFPELNIKHFNQMMGTDFEEDDKKHNGDNAAEKANSKILGDDANVVGDGIDVAGADGVGTELSSGDGDGGGMSESLTEAKRQVRRYYIRPQDIFCANKADVIKALIEVGDNNCSVYTLKYLGDEKDITKLTNKDIIYYYDNGVLSDKNHVKVMDYDLYIKHEEERRKFPTTVEKMPDAAVKDEYKDRLVDATIDIEENFNPFELYFEPVNALGESIKNGGTCCICGEEYQGYGNNPAPYKNSGKCCDACNLKFVIPARLNSAKESDKDEVYADGE